jgi:hypothetical protein
VEDIFKDSENTVGENSMGIRNFCQLRDVESKSTTEISTNSVTTALVHKKKKRQG